MAISFVAASPLVDTTTETLTVALPTGWAAGDFLLLPLLSRNNVTASWSAVGFTQISGAFARHENPSASVSLTVALYYKIASAGETAVVSKISDGTTGWGTFMVAYRGVDQATPIASNAVANTYTLTLSISVAAFTPAANGNMLVNVAFGGDDNSGLSLSASNGYTVRVEGSTYSTSTGGDMSFGVADRSASAAIAHAGPVWNFGPTAARWGAITFALAAAASASNSLGFVTNPMTAGLSATYSGNDLQNVAKIWIEDANGTATAASVTASNTSGGVFIAPTVAQVIAGNVKFGPIVVDFLASNDSAIGSLSSSLVAPSTHIIHNVTDLSSQSSTACIYFGLGISLSDQLAIRNVTQSYSWSVSIGTGGVLSIKSAGDNRSDRFTYNVYDETDGLWGTTGTFVITTTPILSNFTASSNGSTHTASLAAQVNLIEGRLYFIADSASATPTTAQVIAGQNAAGDTADWATSIAVDTLVESVLTSALDGGGKYYPFAVYVNNGSLTTSVISFAAGFTMESIIAASATNDITPAAFTLGTFSGIDTGIEYTSNEVTVLEIDSSTPVAITVSGGEYAKNTGAGYGAYTTFAGTVVLGDKVLVKHITSTEPLTQKVSVLIISDVTGTFQTTTVAAGGAALASVHDIWEWIAGQGYDGGIGKQTKRFLEDQGYSTGSMSRRLFNWLRGLGYTGTLNKMINDFERDFTIQHGPD